MHRRTHTRIDLTAPFLLLLADTDRFVKVNHTFDTIQRPSHLSGVTVGNLVIPTTTLYIPADKSVCNPETAPVVFLIPGNPGVAEFYSETMREMHSASGKKTHIYCSGHAGQGLIVNQARLSAYLERRKKKFGESSANILPRFECDTLFEDKVRIDLERARAKIAKTLAADAKHKKDDGDGNISSSASKAKSSGGGSGSGGGGAFGDLPSALRDAATNVRANAIQSGGADAKRGGQGQSEDDISAECLGEIENDIDFLSYPFGENAVFDLRSQVQHKLAVLTQLRRLHPYSKFIIAGHSVGGYISLEVLRSIDRIEEIIRSKDRRHAERKDNEYDLRPETFESKLHSASTSTSTSSSSTSSTSPSTLSSPLCPRAAFVLENLYFSDDDWERSEEKNARSADNEALKQMKEMGTDRNDMAVGTSRVLLSVSELEEYKDIALPVRQHPSTIAADSSLSSLSPEYVESLEHRKPGGSSFVAQVQLLCPTVHNIASTPNGYFFTPIFYQWRTTLVLIFMLVASLPGFVRRTLAMIGASPFKSPDCYAATRLVR